MTRGLTQRLHHVLDLLVEVLDRESEGPHGLVVPTLCSVVRVPVRLNEAIERDYVSLTLERAGQGPAPRFSAGALQQVSAHTGAAEHVSTQPMQAVRIGRRPPVGACQVRCALGLGERQFGASCVFKQRYPSMVTFSAS